MLFVVQLSSTKSQLQACVSALRDIDLETLPGRDATDLADWLIPVVRQLEALRMSVSGRAIAANQHNVDEARSAAAWLAEKVGVSERSARRELLLSKALNALPIVDNAARNGWISLEVASVITRGSGGDRDIARDLLEYAGSESVEQIERRVQEMRAANPPADDRLTQSAHIRQVGSRIRGRFDVLAASSPWFAEWSRHLRDALQANAKSDAPLPAPVVEAEAFNTFMSQRGSSKSVIVYHVDIPLGSTGEARAELAGVGPVPVAAIDAIKSHAELRYVLTLRNKLAGYYEGGKLPSPDKPLPDVVKRAVKAHAYDTCEAENCLALATDVDHICARGNGGTHALDNLQALCKPDHDAKTRVDAPWTGTKFYFGARVNDVIVTEFDDTG